MLAQVSKIAVMTCGKRIKPAALLCFSEIMIRSLNFGKHTELLLNVPIYFTV
jgi:hypothetical protein